MSCALLSMVMPYQSNT